MAKIKPTCSVDNCPKPALTLQSGLCSAHYQRAKSHGGDPLGGRAKNGEVIAFFRDNLMTITDECKIWPYKVNHSRNQEHVYGQVWIDGTHHSVHVLACEAFNGPMPEPGMDAAHGVCHNTRCWNGRHLSWKTRKQNMDDQERDGTKNHGERNGSARLTEPEVLALRRRYDAGEAPETLATEFGIARGHVHQIGKRTRWKYLAEEPTQGRPDIHQTSLASK